MARSRLGSCLHCTRVTESITETETTSNREAGGRSTSVSEGTAESWSMRLPLKAPLMVKMVLRLSLSRKFWTTSSVVVVEEHANQVNRLPFPYLFGNNVTRSRLTPRYKS